MSVTQKLRNATLGLAALGALALGGSALANAAGTSSITSTTQGSTTTPSGDTGTVGSPSGRHRDPTTPGGHVGRNGTTEQALSAGAAAKVKAAAEAKVPGSTVERVETDADHGSPYEAHVRTADGTQLEILVDEHFAVTAVNTMQRP